MKTMFTIIFAFFVVQCAFAQKMQIHTSTMGTIEIELSKVDSITFTTVTSEPGGLTANPDNLDLTVGQQKTSTITGGTTPYSILTSPNPGVASASISGSVLTVTGVGNGNTYVLVKDNSGPYKTAWINISVHQIFTSPGSLSFTSTVGNFSATGIFDNASDSMPTNSQGAGGYFSSNVLGPFAALQVVGYFKNSSTNWDIAVVMYMDSANVSTGTFSFLTGEGPIKRAEFLYVKGWNPSDTSGDPFNNGNYVLVTGSASLSSFTGTSAQGTFSGTGSWYTQNIPDPTKPITLTNGNFTTPVISGSILKSPEQKAIEKLLHRLSR